MAVMGRACQLVFLGYLWVLLLVAGVRSDTAGSCNLMVSASGSKMPSGICIAEGPSDTCNEFIKSFNTSLLPESFRPIGRSIEKPSALRLDPVYNDYQNTNLIPGMRIVWSSPISDTAMENLEGFLLVYETNTGTGSGCRLFKLDQEKLSLEVLEFTYELQYVARNAELSIKVYSWPPPSPAVKDNPSTFQRALAKTGAVQAKATYPKEWVPVISLKNSSDGSLDVGVSLAPANFSLTIFEIKLLKCYVESQNTFKTGFLNTTGVPSGEKTAHYVFRNLESGDYKVVVRPYDTFHMEEGKCLCWIKEGEAKEKICKNVCSSIQSQCVHLDWTPTAVTTSLAPATQTPTSTSNTTIRAVYKQVDESSGLDTEILIPIVGIPVLVLALFIAYLIWRRRNNSGKAGGKSSPGSVINFDDKGPAKLQSVEKSKGPLLPKTIYILSSEDHPLHVQLVDCLSNFLDLHCSCRVIYPPWNDLHGEGGLQWFLANINVCDFILFVDSEGAERLMEAHMKHMVYRQRPVGPEGDLFLMGVKHILAHQVVDHVVPVCFGVERCKKYLLSPVEYDLPKHLSQLLQKIHGLSSRDVEMFSSELPLHVDNVGELPCGAEMLSAIKASQQYELQHPGWFAESFGEPTPTMKDGPFSCSSSGDSDYGSGMTAEDSMLSVSNAGSPVAVFDHPSFGGHSAPTFARSVSTQPKDASHFYSPQFQRQGPGNFLPGELKECDNTKDLDLNSVVTVDTGFGANSRSGRGLTLHDQVPGSPWPLEHIIPPDSASSVFSDNVSAALRDVNRRHETADLFFPHREQQCEDNQVRTPVVLEHRNMDPEIIPPDSLSDAQIDSFSAAFRESNARCAAAFEDQKDEEKMEGDEEFVTPDYDAISV